MWIYSIQQVKVAKEIGPKKKMRGGAKSVLRLCAVRFCTPPGMATDLSLSTPAANATREGGS